MPRTSPGASASRPRSRRARRLVAACGLMVLWSCGDATGPAGPGAVEIPVDQLAFTYLGETAQLAAAILDPSGKPLPDAQGVWRSLDPSVATVSATGLVTAVGDGATSVTLTAGGVTGSVAVTVDRVPASLSLAPAAWSFDALGDTARLAARVLDAGGSPMASAAVTWSSDDPAVATVDSGGRVTAVGNGTTTLRAAAGEAAAAAAVTVEQAVSSLYLSADSLVFDALGDTTQVVAVALDPGGSPVPGGEVSWSTSDGAVVTVDGTGLATSVANGAGELTVWVGSASRVVPVRVAQVVAELRVAPDSVVFRDPGDETALAVEAFDRLGSPVSDPEVAWEVVDLEVAEVSAVGMVRGVGTGATVVAAAAGTARVEIPVRVEAELALEVPVSEPLRATVAAPVALSAVVRDVLGELREGVEVSWRAAPGSGSITAGASGVSDASGGVQAEWTLGTGAGPQRAFASLQTRGRTVEVVFDAEAAPGPAVTAALAADSVLLSGTGEAVLFLPAFADLYGNPTSPPSPGTPGAPTWTSRDPSVLSVDAAGVGTAEGAGATWVALSVDGPADSVLVTVALRGAITLTFDDGWRSVYDNAWPVIREFPGIRANVAVYVNATAWPGFLSPAHLDEFHAVGWSMASHTMTHDSLTTLTPAELAWELGESRAWLDARGYRGTDVLVAPYHDFDDAVRDAAAGYYVAARGISANATWPETLVPWMPALPYHLTGIEADTFYTSPEGRSYLRSLMQRAVDEGAFLDVFFHQIPPESVEDFRAFLGDLYDFRDRVLPYHDLFPAEPRTVY